MCAGRARVASRVVPRLVLLSVPVQSAYPYAERKTRTSPVSVPVQGSTPPAIHVTPTQRDALE